MKWILALVLLLGVFLSGWYLGSSKEGDVVYIPDTTPPVHTIIKPVNPTDTEDLIARANAMIQLDRTWDDPVLTIEASDGYKSSRVQDKITFAPKKHFVFGGIGVDKSLSLLYSAGYTYRFFGYVNVGAMLTFSQTSFNSVSLLAGMSF
jgi:hypothetical protein